MQLSKPPKPKATRKRLKKQLLSDDFKIRKIFWKNIAENFLENFPYEKILYGKFSTSHNYKAFSQDNKPVAVSTSSVTVGFFPIPAMRVVRRIGLI
jgi:hypothetical protein